jgi:hypothetical protein
MKNASIQVNAEKRIVNVGLRLFCNTFIITIPFFTLLSPFYGPNPSGIPSLEGTLKKN